jgi:hypothetical protein
VNKSLRSYTLTAGLLLGMVGLGYAADTNEVLIDSARNAVIKTTTTSPNKGYTGSIDAAGDFAKGLSTIKGDIKLSPEDQKSVADSKAFFYTTVGQTLEAVGNVDLVIQPDKDKPSLQSLDGNLQLGQDSSTGYSKGEFTLGATAAQELPQFAVNGTVDASGKLLSNDGNFSMDLKENAEKIPFKSLQVDLTEAQNTTTLAVSVLAPSSSPMASNLRMIGKNPDQVKTGVTAMLGQFAIQVDKVELTEYKDGPEGVSGKLTIAIKEWRPVAKAGMSRYMDQAGDAIDKTKAASGVDELLAARIDDLNVKLSIDKSTLSGSVHSKIENTESLALGYYDVIASAMEGQFKQKTHRSTIQRVIMAMQLVQIEDARKTVQVLAESGMSVKGSAKLSLDPAPADKAKGTKPSFTIKGDLDSSVDHVADYLSKAKAAHLPVADKVAGKATVHLAQNGHLAATLYGYSDANILDFYRQLAVDTATKVGATPDAIKLVDGVQVKGGTFEGKFDKGEVSFNGYAETSNLVPAFSAVFRGMSEGATADVTGFHVSSKFVGQNNVTEFALNLAKFMEGKSASEVKKFFPGTVKEKVPTADVQLAVVTKTEVPMPAELVAVEADGKKLLGSGSIAMGTAGAGGSKLPYVLGGALVLVLAGLGAAAAARKKS